MCGSACCLFECVCVCVYVCVCVCICVCVWVGGWMDVVMGSQQQGIILNCVHSD